MSAVIGAAAAERRPGPTVVGGGAATLERLAQAIDSRPDLAVVAPFWMAIYRVQIAAREALEATQLPLRWTLRRERLAAGSGQLDVDDLPLAAGPLESLVGQLGEVWRQHDPGRAAGGQCDCLSRVRRAFADPTLALGQRRELGFDDALAALALAPYLEWAAAATMPTLRDDLESWARSWCPVCAGLPDLAVLAGDPAGRSLVCSRCSTVWPYQRVGCPFCRGVERQAYHASDDEKYRLYLCGGCRRYLKTADARRLGGSLDPRVERLTTIGMDLAALEAGYGPQ